MFNINAKEVVKFTNRLEKMHKSDLPVAVRGALNDAAFFAKTKNIPAEFGENFEQRKNKFIQSHTAFNKSPNTFDISKMYSEAGVIKGKSKAGDNLEKQEFGGTVPNREYIPMDAARVGKSNKKLLSRRFYLKNIKPKKGKMRMKSQEFIKAAFKAGKGGFVRYDNYLFAIKTIQKTGSKLNLKADPVYSFEEGRTAKLKSQPFIKPAGEKAASKIAEYFVKQAERRIYK